MDLISGFRNAGKTTLISAMADTLWVDEKVVLLQNERGTTEIKGISRSDCFVEQWQGGCICCSAAALFDEVLLRITEQYEPSRVVIELAETARLADIKALFAQREGDFRIEHILYVLNAADFAFKWDLSQRFVEQQIAECPTIVLNRTESAGPDACGEIMAKVWRINPRCRVFESPTDIPALYQSSSAFRQVRYTTKVRTNRQLPLQLGF